MTFLGLGEEREKVGFEYILICTRCVISTCVRCMHIYMYMHIALAPVDVYQGMCFSSTILLELVLQLVSTRALALSMHAHPGLHVL